MAEESSVVSLGSLLMDCKEVLSHHGLGTANTSWDSIGGHAAQAFAGGAEALKTMNERMRGMRQELDLAGSVLDHVQRRVRGLDDVASYFRALALNMKIRASVVPGAEDQFAPMILSTHKLSSDIASKSTDLQELVHTNVLNGKQTVESLGEVCEHLEAVLNGEKSRYDEISASLLQLNNQRAAGIAQLEVQNRDLEDLFGELVISLQFHDRLRQRVEHIVQVEEYAKSQDNPALSVMLRHIDHVQITEESEALKSLGQSVGSALADLDCAMDSWMRIVAQNDDGVLAVLGKLEDMIVLQKNEYQRSDERALAAVAQVENYGLAAQKIAEHLRVILDWKVEAKLLSMNSILIAGQLGSAGSGLRVLSKEIVATSESLATIVEELKVASDKIHLKKENDILAGTDNFRDALGAISTMKREIEWSGKSRDEALHVPIRQKMADAHRAMNCLTVLWEALEKEKAVLEPAQSIAMELPQETMDFLVHLYTMEDERNVLMKFCGRKSPASEQKPDVGTDDNIELF